MKWVKLPCHNFKMWNWDNCELFWDFYHSELFSAWFLVRCLQKPEFWIFVNSVALPWKLFSSKYLRKAQFDTFQGPTLPTFNSWKWEFAPYWTQNAIVNNLSRGWSPDNTYYWCIRPVVTISGIWDRCSKSALASTVSGSLYNIWLPSTLWVYSTNDILRYRN